jgi:HK97 gp10 family phage protein
MAKTQVRITGARQLEAVLKKLPHEIRGRVLDAAMRAGGRVLQQELKATAPVGAKPHPKYGHLRDNVRVIRVKRSKASAHFAVSVGRAFWAIWLEFGAAPHVIEPRGEKLRRYVARRRIRRDVSRFVKRTLLADQGQVFGRKVDHPGVTARPWMRPAFDKVSLRMLDATGKSLGAGIARAARRLAGPYAKSGLRRRR